MKKIIYICDECNKVLSDESKNCRHLSIKFSNCSGWVSKHPLKYDTSEWIWEHDNTLEGVKQFCDGKCLGRYFDKLKNKLKK